MGIEVKELRWWTAKILRAAIALVRHQRTAGPRFKSICSASVASRTISQGAIKRMISTQLVSYFMTQDIEGEIEITRMAGPGPATTFVRTIAKTSDVGNPGAQQISTRGTQFVHHVAQVIHPRIDAVSEKSAGLFGQVGRRASRTKGIL